MPTNVGREDLQRLVAEGAQLVEVLPKEEFDAQQKPLELLREMVPSTSRVGVLTMSSVIGPGTLRWHPSVLETAKVLGLTLITEALDAADQAPTALARLIRQRVDALFADGTAPNLGARREIAGFALKHRLPLVSLSREIAEAGGLLFYNTNFFDLYRAAPYSSTRSSRGQGQATSPLSKPRSSSWSSTSRPRKPSA